MSSWDHSSAGSGSARRRQKDAQIFKVEHESEEGMEKKIDVLKKRFLHKNETKMSSLQDIFRVADKDKMGSLGREELEHAFEKVGGEAGPQILDHLLSTRATDKERLSFNDFMRFFDDRSGNMLLLKRPLKAPSGDFAKMTHLWSPTKPDSLNSPEVGTLNDVLEADKRADGLISERLDGNFSGVQFDIINFNSTRPIPPTVIVPIRKRDSLFEFPNPHGRRVNFDHGDTPWNVVSVRTPRTNKRTSLLGQGMNDNVLGADTWRRQTSTTNVPVSSFACMCVCV